MPRSRFRPNQAQEERQHAGQVRLETLKIEYVPRESIHPNDYNPNRQSDHEFELLCRSMRDDGFTQPVLIAEDSTIVDGEHRWKAAAVVGIELIPIVRIPLPPAQARIATLRHNRARGTEDLDLSAAVLRDLERLGALDWAAEGLMLTDAEVERLVKVPEPEDYKRSRGDESPQELQEARQREAQRQREDEKDEQAQARAEGELWNLSLTYTDEEADIVREVLQDRPAANLLELCRQEAERRS